MIQIQKVLENILFLLTHYPVGPAWTSANKPLPPFKSSLPASSYHSQFPLNHLCPELLVPILQKSPSPPSQGCGGLFLLSGLSSYDSSLTHLVPNGSFSPCSFPHLLQVILSRFLTSEILHEYPSKDNERMYLVRCTTKEGCPLYPRQIILYFSQYNSLEQEYKLTIRVTGIP